jgi:hypothetical protein
MTDEERLEARWGRALVHESGHALMAVRQLIPCDGIYYMKTCRKVCNVAYLPPVSGYSPEHFLFHSAGSAAELLTYGNYDSDASKSDRLPFERVGAPTYEETVGKSRSILAMHSAILEGLVSTLKSKCLQISLDLNALPEIHIAGIGDTLGVLLSKQEFEDKTR